MADGCEPNYLCDLKCSYKLRHDTDYITQHTVPFAQEYLGQAS